MNGRLLERSRLDFKLAATTIPITDNNEPLVQQARIEELGLLCQPFWQQADDLEGECYLTYLAEHPDFSLSLRNSVVRRLLNVQLLLPKEWCLVLKAGFRPSSVQVALLDALCNDIKRRSPTLSNDEILEQARAYVADPRVGCPPHTTGGAVDVDVLHAHTQLAVAMGCPPNTDDERAALHSTAITPEEYENRLILLKAMLKAGFAPHHNEWWHYSYGETRWAAFYNHPRTLYGIIND